MKLSHLLLREGLKEVQRAYSDFEILPVKMVKPNQPDVLCIFSQGDKSSYRLVGAGAWWAYSIGRSNQMPKNDVPNISVNCLPWGLDFAINAELRTSQSVMRDRIEADLGGFDKLISEHGHLRLQAWLKFEYQPRLYYWVLMEDSKSGSWQGRDLLSLYESTEREFVDLGTHWIAWIKSNATQLSASQIRQMEGSNRNVNLALRLVYSFGEMNGVWKLPFSEQTSTFSSEYAKLRPLIGFFQ
jgi:hypothetical protein